MNARLLLSIALLGAVCADTVDGGTFRVENILRIAGTIALALLAVEAVGGLTRRRRR